MQGLEITARGLPAPGGAGGDHPGVAYERLAGLQLRVLRGSWGCIVCQGLPGIGMGYLDCQYFIFSDTLVTLELAAEACILRTHTTGWFPWKMDGARYPARFEEEGALIRMRPGTTGWRLKAGEYRTSDFFFGTDLLRRYLEACPRLGSLLEGPCPLPVGCLERPFIVGHAQKKILDEIHHGDKPGHIMRHYLTLKGSEYLIQAMSQFQGSGPRRAAHPEPDHETAERIADYLRAHLQERILLKDLARVMTSNTVYIQRAFKARYGMTIRRFLHRLRVDRARYLIARGEAGNLTDIAILSGFCDASALSRAFKEEFGVRPQEYRRTRAPVTAGIDAAG